MADGWMAMDCKMACHRGNQSKRLGPAMPRRTGGRFVYLHAECLFNQVYPSYNNTLVIIILGSTKPDSQPVQRPPCRSARAAQPGRQGILLASRQAGTWPASLSNGQAGVQAAAREKLARQADGFGSRPATELFWRIVSPNLPEPGNNKIE